MRRSLLLSLVALLSCTRELTLPPAPQPPSIAITGLDRTEGWAGTRVRIDGRHLGASPGLVQVRFGTSRSVAPLEADAKGESFLVVAVPDDATTGPVSVQSPAGAATSAEPFTFRGLGRPRFNAVTRSVGFQPLLLGGFPDGKNNALVLERKYGWAGSVPDKNGAAPVRVGGRQPLAIAPARDGRIAAIVDADPTDCPPDAFGRLWIAEGGAADEALGICLPRGGPDIDTYPLATVAIDEEATHAVVSTNRTVTLVDLEADPPALQTWPTSEGSPLKVAWAGGSVFLAADLWEVSRLDWTHAELGLHDSVDGLALNTIERIAVAPGHLLALKAEATRRIFLYDLATWPPKQLETLRLSTAEISGLALSSDGTRAAVSATDSGTIYVHDLSQEAYPVLAAHAQAEVGEVFSLPGSRLFSSAGAGEVLVLSEVSGALVRRIAVRTNARTPLFRRIRTGDTTEEVLDLPLATFNTIVRLRAAGLEHVPLDAWFDGAPIDELVGTPDGPAFARHGDEIRRLDERAGVISQPLAGRLSLPLPSRGVRTTVSDDGAVLVLHGIPDDEDPPFLKLLDARGATWPSEPPSYELPPAPTSRSVALVTSNLLVTWRDAQLQGLDLTAALQGTLTPRWSIDMPQESASTIHLADGRIYLTTHDAGVQASLHVVDPATGHSERVRLPGWEHLEVPAVLVPAGGRRLLAPLGNGDLRTLRSIRFVPETAELGGEDLPVPLPASASDFALSDDGSRLFVVDDFTDRLLVVE